MEQRKPSTPEGQLLKLIENSPGEGISKQNVKRTARNIFSFAAIRGRFSYFKNHFKPGQTGKKNKPTVNFRSINRLLKFTSFLIFLYLASGIVLSVLNFDKSIEITLDNGALATVQNVEAVPMLKKFPFYTEMPKERDIFKFKEVTVTPKKEIQPVKKPVKEKIVSKIQELIKDLRLVGISWSEDPDVMIENTTTKTTYFLKRGQKIGTGVKVEAIFANKVVLSYEGEEAELK